MAIVVGPKSCSGKIRAKLTEDDGENDTPL
jgi:hypothetical protein